jgi:hypothetical protein
MTEQTPTPDDTAQPSPAHSETTESTAPSADLVLHASTLDARIRYSRQIAAAGTLLPKAVRDGIRPGDLEQIAARTFLITETGSMLGIHPIAALQGVVVIEGKPTLSPALMQTLVRRAGHRFRVRQAGTVAGGDIAVTAVVVRSDDPEPFEATWDLERAQRAGLCTVQRDGNRTTVRARSSKGDPLPWEKYTEAMLKARATAEVCRDAAGDVLMGANYTPEELDATVNAEGEFVDLGHIEATVEQAPERTPQQVADDALARALAAPDEAALLGLWRVLPNVIGRHSWARDYTETADFGRRVEVDYPLGDGQTVRIPLLEAFAERKRTLEGGGDDEGGTRGTRPTDEPTPPAPADDVVDAVVEPDTAHEAQGQEDVHDADVVDEPVDDPWQTPGPQSLDEHDAAIDRMTARLGATVVTDEAASPRDRVAAQHAAQQEQRERETPVEELGGTKTAGAGKAALAAARAELDRRNEERRTAQAAGATPKGRGKA